MDIDLNTKECLEEEECGNAISPLSAMDIKVTPKKLVFQECSVNSLPLCKRSSSLPDERTTCLEANILQKGFSLDSKCRSVWVQTHQKQDKIESYKYGWWCLRPSCLQRVLNNAKAFLLLVTLANVLQGIIVNGLLKVNVTSIERRYKLLSSESGLIISSYDIAGCLCLLPMSYIGGRGHKPRWISVGVLMMGIGSFILAMPRFLAGPYEYTTTFSNAAQDVQSGLCRRGIDSTSNGALNTSDDLCDGMHSNDAYLKQMKYVFMLGQFFNGIGNTPLGVLAVTFVDENVNKRVYPIYIGIYYLGALLGPAFGFVLGGQLLTTFTNLNETPEDITPESPMWVGAWWVGFIIAGTLTILLSVPLFGYPRKLERHKKKRKKTKCCYTAWWRSIRKTSNEATQNDEMSGKYYSKNEPESSFNLMLHESEIQPMATQQNNDSIDESTRVSDSRTSSANVLIKNFFKDILAVVSNRAFMFLSLSAAIYSTLVSGFSTFGPKFIESQLGKSAADAANLFGYVCIPAGAGGMLIGAFLMTGLKMNQKSALQMCVAVSLSGLLAQFVLVLNCPDADLAGITVPYNQYNTGVSDPQHSILNITAVCNKDCSCLSNVHFNPVCGENDVTFFSPCHAGCSVTDLANDKMFQNCSCIQDSEKNSVKSGICSKTCQWQTLILFSLFVVILTTFICTVPGVDLSLRCFPYHQRSLAIGVQWVLIRTLGSIPGPIIFGAMIDGTCLLWGEATCNAGKGSCLMYKNSELSLSFLVLSVIYKATGIVTLCLALVYIERDTIDLPTQPTHNYKKPVVLPMTSTSSNLQTTNNLSSAVS